jgi:hypothetical protein
MRSTPGILNKAMVVLGIFSLPAFISCQTAHEPGSPMKTAAENEKTITVTGTALHAKAGAVVETTDGVYYIKNRQDWGDLYGKKVKVTGTLETVTTKPEDLKNEKGEYVQGFSGTVQYIANAQVEEVK